MLSQQQGGLFCPMCLFKIACFFPPYMIGLFTCLQHVPWESEKEVPGNLIVGIVILGQPPFWTYPSKKKVVLRFYSTSPISYSIPSVCMFSNPHFWTHFWWWCFSPTAPTAHLMSRHHWRPEAASDNAADRWCCFEKKLWGVHVYTCHQTWLYHGKTACTSLLPKRAPEGMRYCNKGGHTWHVCFQNSPISCYKHLSYIRFTDRMQPSIVGEGQNSRPSGGNILIQLHPFLPLKPLFWGWLTSKSPFLLLKIARSW